MILKITIYCKNANFGFFWQKSDLNLKKPFASQDNRTHLQICKK
jgi:hypothetical protein